MGRRLAAVDLFKGRHFDREIIVLCVRWYLSFKLSSRDLVQIMSERGIALAHTTATPKASKANTKKRAAKKETASARKTKAAQRYQ
jgi:transposase-like protein